VFWFTSAPFDITADLYASLRKKKKRGGKIEELNQKGKKELYVSFGFNDFLEP
jgi:hypothetical protein